ncbi:L-asparaginase/beta-aspartyl-peptidase (threonine type) [Duganella sp. 1224]|uniref:isoaspartyl peptidase/L-asparaginase n=1 Tax=Duganella sp. 1224 TaxID=2587052 RepID=UPI0015CED70C|nr:isoaspartyl peptidase/L-asparaginase [Duganella sp. 1224]NYE60709.1 L-asparaginase/beta-aspartyl-peptidase (threonine type) [Duganella sp. 1224]
MTAALVVHGGAGAGAALRDGCQAAADAGARRLADGGGALDAAIAAVLALEDDGRFNAGTGAALGLDGQTVEMDAALMDTHGTLAAVAALRSVKNPILVARDVARTPHYLLAGEGAQRFARMMGHGPYDVITDHQRAQHAALLAKMATGEQPMAGVDNQEFARYWNYAGAPTFGSHGCDTVGAVVRDAHGHFAVAGSTGGSAPSLLGRVGDTPLVGCGFYAGPAGAVAATGIGEYIIRTMLAITVYHWIAAGMDLHAALRQGIGLVPPGAHTGLIAVSKTQCGWHANASTPFAHHGQLPMT